MSNLYEYVRHPRAEELRIAGPTKTRDLRRLEVALFVLIVILFLLPRGIVPSLARLYLKRRGGVAVPDAVAFSKHDAKEPA